MKQTTTKLVIGFALLLFMDRVAGGDVRVIANHHLRQMTLEDVPEEVIVEHQRRDTPGTEQRVRAFILDSLPSTWHVPETSQPRRGARSIAFRSFRNTLYPRAAKFPSITFKQRCGGPLPGSSGTITG